FRRNNYKFNYMIKTDGYACSILFIKTDANGDPVNIPRNFKEKIEYIEKIEITNKLRNKEIITIDPGKSDLITAMKENNDPNDPRQHNFFKYTQGMRKIDLKSQCYKEERQKYSRRTVAYLHRGRYYEKSVKELE